MLGTRALSPARRAAVVAAAALGLAAGAPRVMAAQAAPATPPGGAPVARRATGTFEVRVAPVATDTGAAAGATPMGRMTLDKQFRGDLVATGRGEMLTAVTRVEGSAAYVAIERVTGTLGGRRGTFVLQHAGTMTRGAQHLVITVVPDSGTDGLAGLAGTMRITVAGGRHDYDFAYTLPGGA